MSAKEKKKKKFYCIYESESQNLSSTFSSEINKEGENTSIYKYRVELMWIPFSKVRASEVLLLETDLLISVFCLIGIFPLILQGSTVIKLFNN